MKFSEKWGDSVESAVSLALTEMGLTEDQVNVTVLEEPSKGFFGIGSKLAKVRVEEKEAIKEVKEEKAEEQKSTTEEKKPRVIYTNEMFPAKEGDEEESESEEIHERAPRERKERQNGKRGRRGGNRGGRNARGAESYALGDAKTLVERPTDLEPADDHIVKTFLAELFEKMGLEVNMKVSKNAESVYVDIDGPDSGTVIGKRGQTLDAIQYLASLVVNKDESGYIRVVIDAEGYREKREGTLEKLANRLADKALKTGRTVRLEPMNPYERKVIHTALQKRPEVTTSSEGEEPFRRVLITPVK